MNKDDIPIQISGLKKEVWTLYSYDGLIRGVSAVRNNFVLPRIKVTNISGYQQTVHWCEVIFRAGQTIFQKTFYDSPYLKQEIESAYRYTSNPNFKELVRENLFYSGPATDNLTLKPGESFFIFAQFFDIYSPKKLDRVSVVFSLADGICCEFQIPLLEYSQKNKYSFPMKGKLVLLGHPHEIWGHRTKAWDEFAVDVMVLGKTGKTYAKDPLKLKDHYCFGQKVFSPGDGVVAHAWDGLEDNPIPYSAKATNIHIETEAKGFPLLQREGGNIIVIDHGRGEFSNLLHLKRGSVRVKPGDHVVRDQWIGRCGNSGAGSNAPHLHFHFTNGADYCSATSLPIGFEDLENAVFSNSVIGELGLPNEFISVIEDSSTLLKIGH